LLLTVTAEDAGGIFCQRFLPGPYLAGVDFKAIGQLGYRLLTL